MQYVDEGEGHPLVFVHGTPTWSFLYRHQIKALFRHYRCIAPDHIGFGLSDKPADYPYSAQQLAENFEAFLQQLDLPRFTLVVHDFGGPIGLSYALKHPEQVERIVLFNTWMWSNKGDKQAQQVDRIVSSRFGGWLYRYFNLSPRLLLPQGFADKSKLTKTLKQCYTQPFARTNERYGTLGLARSLMGDSGWYDGLWKSRARIQDKPVLLLWGVKDAFFDLEKLERWKSALNNYELLQLDCGHFPQEEAPESVSEAIRTFLQEREANA
jgi:haloalkane dehalogenase